MQNLLSSGPFPRIAVLVAVILALMAHASTRPLDATSDRSTQYTFPVQIPISELCPYGLWPLNEVASGKITITIRYNPQNNNLVTGDPCVGGVEGMLLGSVSGTKWVAKEVTEVHEVHPILTKQSDGSLGGRNLLYIKVIGMPESSTNVETLRLPSRPEPPVFVVKLSVSLKFENNGVLKVDKISDPEITCT